MTVTHTPGEPSLGQEELLREAAQNVISERFETYKARNGRNVGIQDTSGEKCWIVPFDSMARLEAALEKPAASQQSPSDRSLCEATPITMSEDEDIVDRLRSESFTNGDTDIRWQAADEIDRLRAKLKEIS